MKKYFFFQIVLFSILFVSCKFEKDDEMKLMVDPSDSASAEKPDSLITLPSGQESSSKWSLSFSVSLTAILSGLSTGKIIV